MMKRPGGRSDGLIAIRDEISSFDVCGRSWADPPRDAAEMLFNTFKPVFCSDRKGPPTLKDLTKNVYWLEFGGSDLKCVSGAIPDDIPNGPLLLVICSDAACRALLGKSMANVFSMHIQRDDRRGEKAGLLLSELGVPSASMLHTLFKTGLSEIELALVPDDFGRRFKVRGISPDRAEEMRTDYIRCVHGKLGCRKHALW